MYRSRTTASRGGYVKKARERVVKRPVEVPVPVVVPPKPIPVGGWEAMLARHGLRKALSALTTDPFVVSIDERAGKWILVVRGYEPPFEDYAGHEVIYRPSAFIRNPLSRRMIGDAP